MVELSVSVAILATVLLASIQSNVSARRLATEAMETQRAVRVIESARAIVEDAELLDVSDAGGAVEPGVGLNVANALEGQVVSYSLPDWVPGTPVPRPLGVRFTVSWTARHGHPRTFSVLDAVR